MRSSSSGSSTTMSSPSRWLRGRRTAAHGFSARYPSRTAVFMAADNNPWTLAINKAQNPVDSNGEPDPDARRLTKRPRIHDLRHTHASWMLAEGMDMFTLSRRLGHETYATTDSRYSHLMPAQQLVAANVAAAAMGRLKSRT